MDTKALKRSAADAIAAKFSDIRQAFKFIDVDNTGTIDAQEIFRALDLWNIPLSRQDVDRLVKQCDSDGDGRISYDEFVDTMARDTVAPAAMGKRGMQSKEAMGVDAFEAVDLALGHGKPPKAGKSFG